MATTEPKGKSKSATSKVRRRRRLAEPLTSLGREKLRRWQEATRWANREMERLAAAVEHLRLALCAPMPEEPDEGALVPLVEIPDEPWARELIGPMTPERWRKGLERDLERAERQRLWLMARLHDLATTRPKLLPVQELEALRVEYEVHEGNGADLVQGAVLMVNRYAKATRILNAPRTRTRADSFAPIARLGWYMDAKPINRERARSIVASMEREAVHAIAAALHGGWPTTEEECSAARQALALPETRSRLMTDRDVGEVARRVVADVLGIAADDLR